jgi:Sec-independent protein translocase protein TatA
MALSMKEFKAAIKHLDEELDAELADNVQAVEKAIKQGKDVKGRNEDKPWWIEADQ